MTKDQAPTQKDAKRMAKSLASGLSKTFGVKWEGKAWANLGWNYCAEYRGLKVHPSSCGGYMAFLNAMGEPGGIWTARGKEPEDAVRLVFQNAFEQLVVCDRCRKVPPDKKLSQVSFWTFGIEPSHLIWQGELCEACDKIMMEAVDLAIVNGVAEALKSSGAG